VPQLPLEQHHRTPHLGLHGSERHADARGDLLIAQLVAASQQEDLTAPLRQLRDGALSGAPELPTQVLIVRASVAPAVTRVVFEIDGATVGETSGDAPRVEWPLVSGVHALRVHAFANGSRYTATTVFEVK